MFFRKSKRGIDRFDNVEQAGLFINLPTKTFFIGNLQSERSVRVDCNYKGDIVSKGKVVISAEAQMEGNIKCSSALISGKVKGNIVALETLSLKVPAHIKGNILTKNIYIEPGVVIDGVYKIIEGQVEK